MRAIADEARKTNRVLYAYIDDILENQYQWQREAERLSSLLKKKFNNPHRFLFLRGKHARQNDGLSQPSLALTPSCADPLGGNLSSKGHKIVCHERLVSTLRRPQGHRQTRAGLGRFARPPFAPSGLSRALEPLLKKVIKLGAPVQRRATAIPAIVVFGEQHLRRVLRFYALYYNEARTHRSLNKDAPLSRPVQSTGRIVSHALVGGLHHQYVRI
jgi:hypothetical protein